MDYEIFVASASAVGKGSHGWAHRVLTRLNEANSGSSARNMCVRGNVETVLWFSRIRLIWEHGIEKEGHGACLLCWASGLDRHTGWGWV